MGVYIADKKKPKKKFKQKPTDKILKGKLENFARLKMKKAKLKYAIDDLNEKLSPLEKEIYDEMLALNYDKISMLGNTFFPTTKVFFSFADKAKGLQWIKKNQPDILGVTAGTLTTFLKERLLNNRKIPKCFNKYNKETVGMRKNK